jgi:hypothetical protein
MGATVKMRFVAESDEQSSDNVARLQRAVIFAAINPLILAGL